MGELNDLPAVYDVVDRISLLLQHARCRPNGR